MVVAKKWEERVKREKKCRSFLRHPLPPKKTYVVTDPGQVNVK